MQVSWSLPTKKLPIRPSRFTIGEAEIVVQLLAGDPMVYCITLDSTGCKFSVTKTEQTLPETTCLLRSVVSV
jgi:hypothetical protein